MCDLIAKHIYISGTLTLRQLSENSALSLQVLEEILTAFRAQGCIDIASGAAAEPHYTLSQRGREWAMDALAKCAYAGAAPVTLEQYAQGVQSQSTTKISITNAAMVEAYEGVIMEEGLLSQLGAAIVSGRAMLFYGPPGTGKTLMTQRIARLIAGEILVPHAILIGENIVRVLDPMLHKPLHDEAPAASVLMATRPDPRFVRCRRPLSVMGGELTLDMLEAAYHAASQTYEAPAHLKANNGVVVIDDLGRQRVRPAELFNRWITLLEERRDYLSTGTQRFCVPFDIVLAFSTNLNPLELGGAAFLRRLSYKIRLSHLRREQYETVWRQACGLYGVAYDPAVFSYLVDELHAKSGEPFIPCYPRDLLRLVTERCRYHGLPLTASKEHVLYAWRIYFVDDSDYRRNAAAVPHSGKPV